MLYLSSSSIPHVFWSKGFKELFQFSIWTTQTQIQDILQFLIGVFSANVIPNYFLKTGPTPASFSFFLKQQNNFYNK